jgi:hypothetical protein
MSCLMIQQAFARLVIACDDGRGVVIGSLFSDDAVTSVAV